jgi:predicted metalloendopeptidase
MPTRRAKKLRSRKTVCSKADDFYGFVNDDWKRQTEMPPTESRITQAYFISLEIEKELKSIIKTEKEGAIADMARSWRHLIATDLPEALTPMLELMISANTPSDLSARIGWMNRHGIPAPLAIYVAGDPRNNARCRVHIDEGSPYIQNAEYWLEREYVGHRKAYARYVRALAKIVDMPLLLHGFNCERDFAHIYPNEPLKKPKIDMLNWKELCNEFRTIDWTRMLTGYGFKEEELPHMLYDVSSRAFLHHLQRCLKGWSPERWQGWLALSITQYVAYWMPQSPLRTAWFDYNYRYLRGLTVDDNDEDRCLSVIQATLPNMLGQLWVKQFCDPKLKPAVHTMCETIRSAAARGLSLSTWMAPSTRRAAIHKLRAIDIQIGWPSSDSRGENLFKGLDPTDLFGNLLTLSSSGTDFNLSLPPGSCRKPYGKRWGEPVFIVNAYYYPNMNQFLLPAAILRPPYYDPAKSLVWNYAATGSTIGHELCHAFDAEGRLYNSKGDKQIWWSARDSREYLRKAGRVKRLFESVEYRGNEIDGELTLVENIADLGGLKFALDGLRGAMKRPLTKEELREFFTAFAICWRAKDRMKRAAELTQNDSHSPPMLRVNHIVRQFDEWYEAFDVGADCPGYIPPEQRIHFFS